MRFRRAGARFLIRCTGWVEKENASDLRSPGPGRCSYVKVRTGLPYDYAPGCTACPARAWRTAPPAEAPPARTSPPRTRTDHAYRYPSPAPRDLPDPLRRRLPDVRRAGRHAAPAGL